MQEFVYFYTKKASQLTAGILFLAPIQKKIAFFTLFSCIFQIKAVILQSK